MLTSTYSKEQKIRVMPKVCFFSYGDDDGDGDHDEDTEVNVVPDNGTHTPEHSAY
ncbi:hypothetical protein Hanom_Chr11g01009131 [Helianthus anomalus]